MPTHYKGTPKETQALNAFIKLTRAAESVSARLAQRGTHGELSPSQFGVLETLLHLGPMCQSELGTKLLKSSGNITLVIDNLEKRNLVKRIRSLDDRRFIQISLTDAGRELIQQLFPGQLSAIVDEMSILSQEEQITLGHLCRKLGRREPATKYREGEKG